MSERGLLVISVGEADQTFVAEVAGQLLHSKSMIMSPYFHDAHLQEYLTMLSDDFDVNMECCTVYHCPSFVELEAEVSSLVKLKPKGDV